MEEVKLLGTWASLFSQRVVMGLKLKGVKYQFIEEDLTNKSPQLQEYNPVHKKIPVLLHHGKPIAESLVILEYIDETWDGPPLLPNNPSERAMARFWSRFLDEKCWPLMRKASYSTGEEQQKAKEEVTELLKFLDNEMKGKKFIVGDTFGLADISANVLAYWFEYISELVGLKTLDEDMLPNLCKWYSGYTACSCVKETLPPKDKFIDKYRPYIRAATASKAVN